MKALVVGGGIAGAAACYRLTRGGVRCQWLTSKPSASGLSSGALDLEPYAGQQAGQDAWDSGPSVLSPAALEFCRDFGLHDVGSLPASVPMGSLPIGSVPAGPMPASRAASALVVTAKGTLRLARAVDRCVLDLRKVALTESGGALLSKIGVLSLPLRGWDAPWLARSLNELPGTKSAEFVSVALKDAPQATLARSEDLSAYDCAEWFQQKRALLAPWLKRLAEEQQLSAWLLPPACFTGVALRQDWEARVQVPMGETLSDVLGLAGLRFEAARRAASSRWGVEWTEARVDSVAANALGVTAEADGRKLSADLAVLALGSWIGRGLTLDAANRVRLSCEIAPEAGFDLCLDGAPFSVSAESGLDVAALGLVRLSRLGLARLDRFPTGDVGSRIQIAGDLRAGQARTLGSALESGLAAAELLLRRL